MNFLDQQFILPLVVALFVGGAAGALGSFMVMKRMALVGDAFTHVALPGMGLALLWGYDPFWGALLTLTIAVFGIWQLREKSKLPFEALVGIFFTGSLAIGILVVPDPEVLEALFGDIASLRLFDAALSILLAIIIWIGLSAIKSSLILTTVSEDMARASGISVSRVNLIYLILVGILVALGVKFVGALLMGALVIIPAASAQNIAKGFGSYIFLSTFFGIIGAVAGVLLHFVLGFSPGPFVILVSAGIFFATFVFRRYH